MPRGRVVGWRKYGAVEFTIDDPRFEICPTTGCWLWTGALDKDGYGTGTFKSFQTSRVHRATWLRANGAYGPIPSVLDHVCKTRSCVNPDHLRVSNHRLNVLLNSDGLAAINKAKPNCPECGGEYVVDYHGNRYSRRCPPCQRRRVRDCQRKLRQRRKVERERMDA